MYIFPSCSLDQRIVLCTHGNVIVNNKKQQNQALTLAVVEAAMITKLMHIGTSVNGYTLRVVTTGGKIPAPRRT